MKKHRKDPKLSGPPDLNYFAEWDDGDGRAGVNAGPSGLTWWYRPKGPGGRFGEVGSDQTFEEFLGHGPKGGAVPEKVIGELESIIKAQGITNAQRRKSSSTELILEQKRMETDPASIEETREIERYLNWFNKRENEPS